MPDAAAVTAPPHVYVLNAAPAVRRLLADLLESEAYRVTATTFAPASFGQIAGLQPDLLVLDLAVGAREGWDLLAELHAEAATHRIPIVILSTDPAHLERAWDQVARYGAHGVLQGPFDLDDLLALVATALAPAR
jgi:chemosensory pili system protein ChpA (sensor histidine kinase/response regulator)